MIEAGQIAGFGLIGGLVWLWLKIRGVDITPKKKTGTGTAAGATMIIDDQGASDGGSGILGGGSPSYVMDEQSVRIAADWALAHGLLHIDVYDMMTTAYVESSFRPNVERYEPHINDRSVGLTQTLISTAQDMYKKGYDRFVYPTRETLKLPAVSMYYGAAYFDWLRKAYPNKSQEWYVRAYNGGAGHNYNAQTTNHWNKWRAVRNQYEGVA